MDPFATLGLPRRYDVDPRQLETNYRELQRVLHPDRHAAASPSQRRMNLLKAVEVNEAYRTLKNDLSRAEALLALHAAGQVASRAAEDPEFLMEMLELREELGEASANSDAPRIERLSDRIEAEAREARNRLATAFDALPTAAQPAELAGVTRLLGRLKYYRRFLDEVGALAERRAG